MSVIDQLVQIYYEEPWHTVRMSREGAESYYDSMLKGDQIIICVEGEEIIGVLEYARIDLARLGYLMLANTFEPGLHMEDGWIVYVAGLYIRPRYRGLGVIRYLRRELERRNPAAEFFVGETQGKNRKSWGVYQRPKKGVVANGKD